MLLLDRTTDHESARRTTQRAQAECEYPLQRVRQLFTHAKAQNCAKKEKGPSFNLDRYMAFADSF